ncbi:MAG: lipid-A-disaccharide synthase [Saprospiraceae bacterium]|nr:lipid-A-disaccharide synthase [Saprospiraceae bacterium]
MKYFVLAGEASGDKQAALLCEALFRYDQDAVISGWGGEAMTDVGVRVTRHYRELAYMGFVEVIKHLPAIFRNFKKCKQEILALAPDALILIDYPGFNLRMARWAHEHRIPVYYYISPQLWAWHTSRVHGIKKAVRKMYVILPFEKDFYKEYGMEVMYIGHPLAVEIKREGNFHYAPVKGNIALLPGSRKHEVERILPEMAALARRMPELHFTIAAVPHLSTALYDEWLSALPNVERVVGDMKKVLSRSEAAIVTSGTATLETGLLGVPQMVVYKGSPISYQIARRLIKVKFISLVNLIMGRQIVPELIQSDCTAAKMAEQLSLILEPSSSRAMRDAYLKLADLLTSGGGAGAAAIDIISDLGKGKT